MYAQYEKPKENKSRAVANSVGQKKSNVSKDFGFEDRRPEAIVQMKLLKMVNNSPLVKQAAQLQIMDGNLTEYKQPNQTDLDRSNQAFHIGNPISNSYQPVQRAKDDAVEMQGVEAFTYNDIVSWNGEEGEHAGVHFIRDDQVFVMSATWQQNLLGPKYMAVRFNPAHLAEMSAQARYIAVMHELAHLHYEHPGNQHQDSVANEIQADDTALVNAITLYPTQARDAVNDLATFIQKMEDHGHKGGSSHPDNPTRKARVEALLDAILDTATMDVKIESNYTTKAHMDNFFQHHGAALQIDPGDVKTFKASNGEFSYLNGQGTVSLRNYLLFLTEFNARQGLIPNFRHTTAWNVRPVQVQNMIKDQLPGG